MNLLITDTEVRGRRTSVLITDGKVAAIDDRPDLPAGTERLAAHGGALLPGLHDHHLHLRATAAALRSVRVGPPEVTDAEGFRRVLGHEARRVGAAGWVRAVGYHESVAGSPDRDTLDAVTGNVPTRVQHRSGSLWILNSAGLGAAGLDHVVHPGVERDAEGRPTGRIWRGDRLLRPLSRVDHSALAAVSADAAAYGVTGLTEATPAHSAEELADLAAARAAGAIVQRLHLMAPAGTPPLHADGVTLGPTKIILDDDALPTLDQLVAMVGHAHASSRPVAFHCVTEVQAVLALTALTAASDLTSASDLTAATALGGDAPRGPDPGPGGDRIEHASLFPPGLDALAVAAGVTVVTQPHFVAERGDEYLASLTASELDHLYRVASLRGAGVPLAAGSDAPFGTLDPWSGIRAAVRRQTRSGRVLGDAERLSPRQALELYLGSAERPGRPRAVRVGSVADLCLLAVPLAQALDDPTSEMVAATLVGGRLVHPV